MVFKICDAPILDAPSLRWANSAISPNLQFTLGSLDARLAYVISFDYQRKISKLDRENAKLKDENSQLKDDNSTLKDENSRLKDENSINQELVRKSRERNNEIIEKEKDYLNQIEDFKAHLDSKQEKLSSRNSKYSQVKKNFVTMVQNNSNYANRAREAAVKKVCLENNIPLSKYKFPEIPISWIVKEKMKILRKKLANLRLSEMKKPHRYCNLLAIK
ncbi:daple-like protein [Papaver somniferum]|uniref:daple-like protein n=1 Tax=Papaver somniferum TaxID=3469 RepID=UPI000E700464|nr:daple-like protein [Papaver somniferum]